MSSVSRSVYQALKEENKRLLKDIYILCSEEYDLTGERILTKIKWVDKFKKDKQFQLLMKAAAEVYMNEHPELRTQILSFKWGHKNHL